jgi:hypothetical protein
VSRRKDDVSEGARALGRRRWEGVSDEERVRVGAKGGRAAWANLTAAERSAEMKRRAAKRKKRRSRS